MYEQLNRFVHATKGDRISSAALTADNDYL